MESSKKLTTLLYDYPDLLQACVDAKPVATPCGPPLASAGLPCTCDSCKWHRLPYPWNPSPGVCAPPQVSHVYHCLHVHQAALLEAWQSSALGQTVNYGSLQYRDLVDFFRTVPESPMLYSPYNGVTKDKYPPETTKERPNGPVAEDGLNHRGTSIPYHCYKTVSGTQPDVHGMGNQDETMARTGMPVCHPPHSSVPRPSRMLGAAVSVPTRSSSPVCVTSDLYSSRAYCPVILPSDAKFTSTSYHQTSNHSSLNAYSSSNKATLTEREAISEHPQTASCHGDTSLDLRPDSGMGVLDDTSLLQRPASALSDIDSTYRERRPTSALSHFSEFDSGIDDLRARSVTPPLDTHLTPVVEDAGDYSDPEGSVDLEIGASGLDSECQGSERGDLSGQRPSTAQGQADNKYESFMDNSYSSSRLVIATDSAESSDEELAQTCVDFPGMEQHSSMPFGTYSSYNVDNMAYERNCSYGYWDRNMPKPVKQTSNPTNQPASSGSPSQAPWQPWLTSNSMEHCMQQPSMTVNLGNNTDYGYHGYQHKRLRYEARRNTSTPLPWTTPDSTTPGLDPNPETTTGQVSMETAQSHSSVRKRKREENSDTNSTKSIFKRPV